LIGLGRGLGLGLSLSLGPGLGLGLDLGLSLGLGLRLSLGHDCMLGKDVMSKLVVNSLSSLKKAQTQIKIAFEKDRYVNVSITSGKRSLDQNALSFHWYKELSEEGDMSMSEYRNYCKYHFGLPVFFSACSEEDGERAKRMRKALLTMPYEGRLEYMEELSLTSSMNREQMTQYLTEIANHFLPQGFDLTNKEDYGGKS